MMSNIWNLKKDMKLLVKVSSILIFIILYTNTVNASSLVTSGNGRFSIGVINPMQNLDLGFWDGVNDVSVTVGYCVVAIRNGSERRFFQFNTNLNGDDGTNYFLLNDIGDTLNMTMRRFRPSDGIIRDITPNNSVRIDDGLIDCSGQGLNPFYFEVNISAADLNSVPIGEYTTTITTRTRTRNNNNNPEVFDNWDIRIYKPNEIRVNNLSDINFGTYNDQPILQEIGRFCTYIKSGNTFNITFNDNSINNGFFLSHIDAPSNQIPYVLDFTVSGAAPIFEVIEGVNYPNWQGNDQQDCPIGQQSFIRVTIDGSDINEFEVLGGDYVSTLTIIVSPD
jgi:hypothetical protein